MESSIQTSGLLGFKRKELLTSSLISDKINNKSIGGVGTNECKASLLVFPPGKKSRQKFGRLESEGYVVYSIDKKTGCTPIFKTKSSDMEDKADADVGDAGRSNDSISKNNSELQYNSTGPNHTNSHNEKVKKQRHELLQRKKSAQSSNVSCAAVYDDQLFVIRGELLEGYSRKGNCFFYVKTPVTESVHTLVIDTPFIFIAGTFIVTVMQEINKLGFYLCPDRILSFVAFPRHAYGRENVNLEESISRTKLLLSPEQLEEELEKSSTVPEEELFALPSRNNNKLHANGTTHKLTSSGDKDDIIMKEETSSIKEKEFTDKSKSNSVVTPKWSDYLCCCGCVDRYIRVLQMNNMVSEFCCEAAVTAMYVDVHTYRLYYGTQTGSVGVCEINENDSLRKMAVMHSSSSSALSSSSAASMAVTSICTFDLNNDGREELIVGYEDGLVSVYAMLLQQQQLQKPVSRADNRRESNENGYDDDRAFTSKGQELVDSNMNASSMTLLFVLLWRTTLNEKIIRVAAGHVTSSHKSQPDVLVQCVSNKIIAFTLQEEINTNNEKWKEQQVLQNKRSSKSKLGKQTINKEENNLQENEQPLLAEETEEESKKVHEENDKQEYQREQSQINNSMEKLSSSSQGQEMKEIVGTANHVENFNSVNYASEVVVPVPVPEVVVPIPFATFISANQRGGEDDDEEEKLNTQNEELEQIQEMEAFKIEEERLRQELKEKRRIARTWDVTQANIAQLRLEIEQCKRELEAVSDESEYEEEGEFVSNNNTDNEKLAGAEERELEPQQEERREHPHEKEQREICNVHIVTSWVKSEACLRCTFTSDDINNGNEDDDDDDHGIAFIMVSSVLPIKFVELFASSNARVITQSHAEQEHNVALIEVVKAHDKYINRNGEHCSTDKFVNKGCDKEITIQLAIDEGYVPELAPHTSWHAAHAFYFMVLRQSSRVALMRCVHVPALAMYTLTNNVFKSTQQEIKQKTENTGEIDIDGDDNNVYTSRCVNRKDNMTSCEQSQIHTLSWLHYRGNFTEDDVESWITELFEGWASVNEKKEAVDVIGASINNEENNNNNKNNGTSSECHFSYQYCNEQTNTICLIEVYTEVENLTDLEYKNKIHGTSELADEDSDDSYQTNNKNKKEHSRWLQKIVHFVCKSDSITCLFVVRRCLSTLLSAKFASQSQIYEGSNVQSPVWGMTEHIYYTSAYEELLYRIKPRLQHCLQEEYNLGIVDGLYSLYDISPSDEHDENDEVVIGSHIQSAGTLNELDANRFMRTKNGLITNSLRYNAQNALETDGDDDRMRREMLVMQDAVAKCKKFDISKTLLPKAWQCILKNYERTQHLSEQTEMEYDRLHLSPINLYSSLSKRKNCCMRELERCITSVVNLYNSLRAFKYHVDALSAERLAEIQQILGNCFDVTNNQIAKNANCAGDDNDDEFAKIVHMHFPRNEYAYEEIRKGDVLQIAK